MKITQGAIEQRQTTLEIEIEPEDLEHYLDQAYKRLVQRVVVPGFRKGKVPRMILERVVGKDRLVEEALELIVPKATSDAILEQELEISTVPEVEVLTKDPVVLMATVALTPGVDMGDYRSVRVPGEEISIKDDQIQETLEEFRRESAPWEPVERVVRIGDMVVIDLKGVVENRVLFDQKDVSYVVSEEPIPLPRFGESILGMQIGDAREFTLQFPSDHVDATVAGKACDLTVAAKEVKEQHLPSFDDEFAAGVGGGYDSLADLKQEIRDRLHAAEEARALHRYQEEVIRKIREGATIELPPLLIQREADHLLHEQHETLQEQMGNQIGLETYLANVGKSHDELKEDLVPQAEERLKNSALLSQIAFEEGLEVSNQVVEDEIDSLASQTGQQGSQIKQLFQDAKRREALTRNIRTRMIIERLVSIARGEVTTAGSESGDSMSLDPH